MLPLLLFLSVTTAAPPATPDSAVEARKIIERGIEAQGGERQMEKLFKAWRAKVKGKTGSMDITGEILQQPPDKARTTTTLHSWIPVNVTIVNNGDHMWLCIAGVTREPDKNAREEAKDGSFRSRKVRFLLPLLREAGITLSSLPDAAVSDQPARGVRVQASGHRDVDIYFNKDTGLLAKIESRIVAPGKPDILLEQVLSEYRDFDGLKLATKFTKYENHKRTSVEEFVDIKFVDQIDEHEFDKP